MIAEVDLHRTVGFDATETIGEEARKCLLEEIGMG
jgi:hypothetical protein